MCNGHNSKQFNMAQLLAKDVGHTSHCGLYAKIEKNFGAPHKI